MISGDLRAKVDRLWDSFWTGGVSNPAEILEQVSYLMFIRTLDIEQTAQRWNVDAKETQDKRPSLSVPDDRLRWTCLLSEVPEQMFSIVRDEIFPWIRSCAREGDESLAYLEGARFTIPTPGLLARVIDVIEEIASDEVDGWGAIYEYMLNKVNLSGGTGILSAPGQLIDLLVEMMEPNERDLICDPACDSGGFLVSAAKYINKIKKDTDPPSEEGYQIRIQGIDSNVAMVRISGMNLHFHNFVDANVRFGDVLAEAATRESGRYSLVLSKPPFVGISQRESIAEDLLSVASTKKAELLFIVRVAKMLKTEGRAAIIVPDGVLWGSTEAHVKIRRMLVDDLDLEAVIKLPNGIFKPNSGISASALLFSKPASKKRSDVWFYEVMADGWSLDDRRKALLPEEKLGHSPRVKLTSAEHAKNNFPDLLNRWKSARNSEGRRKPSDQSFLVSKSAIAKEDFNLSLNHYRQSHERSKLTREGIRLGSFTEIYRGTISVNDHNFDVNPNSDNVDVKCRVLTASLLGSQLPAIEQLPVRVTKREPRIRLREGDIVGRDLASVRYWSVLPASYEGVQPGNGLVVIRLTQGTVPAEYVAAFLSSPQGEKQISLYEGRPSIKNGGLAEVHLPKFDGDFNEILPSLARLKEGVIEVEKIQNRLRESQLRIFEKEGRGEWRGRLDEAADLSSLIAQTLRKRSDPYDVFQETYPYGIARSVRKFRNSETPVEKHEAALQCVESLILSIGIFAHAVAAYRGRQELPEIDKWKQYVGRGGVSLGHWVAVIRAVGADARDAGDHAAGLAEATAPKKGGKGLMSDLDRLVQLRNKIRHGAGPRTGAEIEKSLGQLEKLMHSSLSWCAFLARARWVHVNRIRWLPQVGKFEASGLVLMGDHPDFEPIAFEAPLPLADDSVYLLTQQGEAIPLSPFCLLSDCPTCLAPELYYPDRLNASTALLKSLDRGHELESDAIAASLRPWIDLD
ncbi:class I SAM-dependent DNA methyltransferase [Actinomadura macrotermitis]|uniref:site-specific DNA-methyltransferase (adenine-specific) n=1 Tax=Actinomadura macrotermitis TaxID=2585200 RepID=A0A7K0C3N5_9ACTN|nr:class I SAM-dependent DNA methyltransferase [Actinomadura macrotermitis]MQY08055.1 hypothetical protein [Actinomadura macrotermitis]